ncbi:nickel-dependent lactate racemase [Clostridium sediminicola]|uniref:nickel-dependent lactate racemase n=1 Tax=Clostridium sediminicola TaxID=3114879 RepID=UPI0031F1E915
MEKLYTVKYGEEKIEMSLNENNVIQVLESKEVELIKDIEKEINYLLDNPIDSKSFDEIFLKKDKVAIVVSDITRAWIQTSKFLPHIVARLNKNGISDADIIIIIANGTHRSQTNNELSKIVGTDIYNRIEIIEHNCDENLVFIGQTSRGTDVEINKLVVDRKVILTGGIVHHLMAGFGGGRKSILPGVAGRKTINQNHLHSLDPKNPHSNPLIGAGVLKGNPLSLDMIEAAKMINPEFLVNSIVNTKGEIIKLVAGNWLTAWEEGCKWTDENFGVTINEKADVVIASCGGYPKDINLYQSTKSLFNAVRALKNGGTLILLAECRDGAGADAFFNWVEPLKRGDLDNELRNNFNIPGYIFYAAIEAIKDNNVILLSSISPEKVEPMGMQAVNSFGSALKKAGLDNKNNDSKIIIMPYAGSTVPMFHKK